VLSADFLGGAPIAMPPANDAMMLVVSWAGLPLGLRPSSEMIVNRGGLTWGLHPLQAAEERGKLHRKV